MERDKRKVVFIIKENEEAQEVYDLAYLFHCVKNMKVATIVFGEIAINGDCIFEKQFSEATVMPSSFGDEHPSHEDYRNNHDYSKGM